MAVDPRPPPPSEFPVGSVVEQKKGNRTYLIVQETPSMKTIVESWEDGLDVANRLLVRLKVALGEMNSDVAAVNEHLAEGVRKTRAKIKANQRLLDELIEPGP
jgi:hypothetical protein